MICYKNKVMVFLFKVEYVWIKNIWFEIENWMECVCLKLKWL